MGQSILGKIILKSNTRVHREENSEAEHKKYIKKITLRYIN